MWIRAAVQVQEQSQFPIPTTYKFLSLLQAENVGREERKACVFLLLHSEGRERIETHKLRSHEPKGRGRANIQLGRQKVATNLSPTCLPKFSRCGKSKSLKQSPSVLSFQGFLANFLLSFPGDVTAGIHASSTPRKQNLGQWAAKQRVSLHHKPLQILSEHRFSTNIPQEEYSRTLMSFDLSFSLKERL